MPRFKSTGPPLHLLPDSAGELRAEPLSCVQPCRGIHVLRSRKKIGQQHFRLQHCYSNMWGQSNDSVAGDTHQARLVGGHERAARALLAALITGSHERASPLHASVVVAFLQAPAHTGKLCHQRLCDGSSRLGLGEPEQNSRRSALHKIASPHLCSPDARPRGGFIVAA